MSKKIKFFSIIIVLSIISLFTLPSLADSGWDSNYDYGGSGSYGSTRSSWNDWDYARKWVNRNSYRSNRKNYSTTDQFFYLVLFLVMFLNIVLQIIKKYPKQQKVTNNIKLSQYYKGVCDELLQKYGINKEEFLKEVFAKYVTIQNAWSDFDYNTLKDNLTNELYNSYIMQLDALKLKNQKNVMSDIKYLDAKIINIKEENGLINVECYLNIEMYDYVVDSTNNVIRGDKNHKIDIEYTITFVKRIDSKIAKCPKCGAELDTIVSGVCSYCRAKVTVDAKDYVMSKKTNIGQRRK